MTPPPPRSTRPDPLFPFTTLFRSPRGAAAPRRPRRHRIVGGARLRRRGEGDRSRPDGRGGARPRGPRAATHIGGGGAGAGARIRGDSHMRKILETLQPLGRSEEHTSELQSLMRNSYAVFCLKNKKTE